jgi:hypothetical protein
MRFSIGEHQGAVSASAFAGFLLLLDVFAKHLG